MVISLFIKKNENNIKGIKGTLSYIYMQINQETVIIINSLQ